MELTNELKARFFSLYWGQKVAVTDDLMSNYQVGIYGGHPNEIRYLSLRPLSSITEKEMKLFYDFCNPDNIDDTDVIKLYYAKRYISELNSFPSDYLRSKGFLLPFMGVPSDQWVEWGVVKLKTE